MGAPQKSLKVSGTIADGLADSCSWVVPSSLCFFFFVSRMLSMVAVHSRLEQESWREELSQALYHQSAGLDFAGAGLGYVLAVRGAVGHIAGFL